LNYNIIVAVCLQVFPICCKYLQMKITLIFTLQPLWLVEFYIIWRHSTSPAEQEYGLVNSENDLLFICLDQSTSFTIGNDSS